MSASVVAVVGKNCIYGIYAINVGTERRLSCLLAAVDTPNSRLSWDQCIGNLTIRF